MTPSALTRNNWLKILFIALLFANIGNSLAQTNRNKIEVENASTVNKIKAQHKMQHQDNAPPQHSMTAITERSKFLIAEQNKELQIKLYLLSLKSYKIEMLIHLSKKGLADSTKTQLDIDEAIGQYMTKNTFEYELNTVSTELNIPNKIPSTGISDLNSFDKEFDKWQRKMYSYQEEIKMFNYEIKNATQDKAKDYQSLTNLEHLMNKTMFEVIK